MPKVHLAVYDLSRGLARTMSQSILGQQIDGIWHTGIVVFDNEYYFGGGIQCTPNGMFSIENNLPPVQMLDLGETSKTKEELETYLRSINHQFNQGTYDLINNNCNNFSDTVSKFLVNQGIPDHIVNLPRIVFNTPGGAMLRPMMENMQRGIQSNNNNRLDPFGSNVANASRNLGTSTNSIPIESIQSLLQQTINNKKMKLEEQAIISGDSSTLKQMIDRISSYSIPSSTDPTTTVSVLTNDENGILEKICSEILKISPNNVTFITIPPEIEPILHRLIIVHPKLQLPCLFLLRLIWLYIPSCQSTAITNGENGNNLFQEILKKLQQGEKGFHSLACYIMAMCTIMNSLSKFEKLSNTLDITPNDISLIVDIAMTAIANNRVEVRQVGATLAYNLTLLFTRGDHLQHFWKPMNETIELHPTAVQLLCGCFEGIGSSETNLTVFRRRLSVICRIIRAYGNVATQLIQELGFCDIIEYLLNVKKLPVANNNSSQNNTDGSPLGPDEIMLLEEISFSLSH